MLVVCVFSGFFFFLMIRRPPRSTHCISSAASDVYKRQQLQYSNFFEFKGFFLIKYEIKMNNDMIKIIISHIIQFENYALKIWFDEYVNLLISNHKKKIASNHNQIYQ
eukprot:TRINITY_DN9457_c0_g1_i5.p2 TRINITY_DN9457_c0_g1~~TRINITY_DN9457_c0_g1_i5.p2  ORF type:complete len:108 (+),score=28.70 TRINITY_DN9457_c0_g1_i5:88-411(+)